MRITLILTWLLLALGARGTTPEVGKDALRRLVKLPTVVFQSNWSFDPEAGFTLGSSSEDVSLQINALQKKLKNNLNDAEAFLQLGDLYATNHDAGLAQKMWAKSADLFRRRLESQPDDELLLAGLGHALQGTGRLPEAESILRKAVQLAPKQWRCRVALGRLLDAAARGDIVQLAAAAGSTPPPVALAQRRVSEAGECFDQAVALAPEEAEVYFRRGLHRCLRNIIQAAVRVAGGESKDDVEQLNHTFPAEALDDLQHASRLRPQDYALIGNTVLFEIYSASARQGEVNWSAFTWTALPDKSQRDIRESITRLENLAEESDPQLAAGALEALGILEGQVLHEPRSAATHLRRALALNPSRDQAWEALVAVLAQSARYEDLLTVCEDRLKQNDTPRAHLLLAKAYEKLKLWDESEAEILIAVKQEPNNFTATLALAALLLKHSGDDSFLPQANTWLGRSEMLLNQTPAPERNLQQVIDLTLTRSIYFALTDEVAAAREFAEAVIKRDQSNKLAQDILSAMDY
jgi:tetratricopeptide (TPR) repeat protein